MTKFNTLFRCGKFLASDLSRARVLRRTAIAPKLMPSVIKFRSVLINLLSLCNGGSLTLEKIELQRPVTGGCYTSPSGAIQHGEVVVLHTPTPSHKRLTFLHPTLIGGQNSLRYTPGCSLFSAQF